LAELSKAVGVTKKFIDMTGDDVLRYLDECRKTETEDPSHKWIGSYNTKLIVLSRFFKWLYYPYSLALSHLVLDRMSLKQHWYMNYI
jgi:hypothetical protein